MSTALITGGLGFIGSFVARGLIVNNLVEKVICVDHFGRYIESVNATFRDFRPQRVMGIQDRIIIERGDTRYQSIVSRLVQRYKPDYIFHLAALPLAKLQNLNTEEAIEGTTLSTTYFLEAIGNMENYRPKRFVYVSSSMTYGDFKSDLAHEDDVQLPKEIYGTMKLAGEVVTRGLGGFFNIPVSIVRPSAVYGPTDMNRRVGQIFIDKALAGKPLTIQGADEKLDFSYVKDVAKGFIQTAVSEKAVGEAFNITCGNARRLVEFVELLKKHIPNLTYKVEERDSFRPMRGTLSTEKAQELIGYKPSYQLEEGVDEYLSFLHSDLSDVEYVNAVLNKNMVI